VAVAISNLASVHMARADVMQAEQLYRQAIAIFTETLSPDHSNTGIARIKLGRVLLRQQRYAEAVQESLAGYEILVPQMDAGVSYLRAARTDLVAAYTSLGQAEMGVRYQAELDDLDRQAAGGRE
jgi:serine/threonine-protein kinase